VSNVGYAYLQAVWPPPRDQSESHAGLTLMMGDQIPFFCPGRIPCPLPPREYSSNLASAINKIILYFFRLL
jgi:hypothetical protein